MFDRITEHARRAIFFARYEASVFSSEMIHTEHLLLGLIREDPILRGHLPSGAGEAMRKRIEAIPNPGKHISTSVDMPLSPETQRAVMHAIEEGANSPHQTVDCGHLVLGLLRIENCVAATLLAEYGIGYASYAEVVRNTVSPPVRDEPAPLQPATARRLQALVEGAAGQLAAYPEGYGDRRLKRKPWTRKQAFGHLVDYAVTHQQWLARALTEPVLVAEGYPADEWVLAERYGDYAWQEVVDLWVGLNRLLVHVLLKIPEDKLSRTCRIGVEEPVPLSKLMERYVEHCEDLVGQILARL